MGVPGDGRGDGLAAKVKKGAVLEDHLFVVILVNTTNAN